VLQYLCAGEGGDARGPVCGAVVDDDDVVDVLAGAEDDGADRELFVVGGDDGDELLRVLGVVEEGGGLRYRCLWCDRDCGRGVMGRGEDPGMTRPFAEFALSRSSKAE